MDICTVPVYLYIFEGGSHPTLPWCDSIIRNIVKLLNNTHLNKQSTHSTVSTCYSQHRTTGHCPLAALGLFIVDLVIMSKSLTGYNVDMAAFSKLGVNKNKR